MKLRGACCELRSCMILVGAGSSPSVCSVMLHAMYCAVHEQRMAVPARLCTGVLAMRESAVRPESVQLYSPGGLAPWRAPCFWVERKLCLQLCCPAAVSALRQTAALSAASDFKSSDSVRSAGEASDILVSSGLLYEARCGQSMD